MRAYLSAGALLSFALCVASCSAGSGAAGSGSGGSGIQGSPGGTTGNGGTSPGSGGIAGGVASGGVTGGGATSGGATSGGATSGGATSGGAGGASGGSGGAASGGSAGGTNPDSDLGKGTMSGTGSSSEQYETAFVSRNDTPYILITNGWGPGFESHTISWEGTSFIVETMSGSRGSMGQPASYPTVFCGRYSVMQVPDCGLPAPRDSITSLRTGWRWAANGNTGAYNAAYDIWVGNGTQLQGYLMVWLRDPPGEQPAGQPNPDHQGITVQNVPGVWNIWQGTVSNRPIINWVRAEGMDSSELEFDVMDFIRDAEARGFEVPGTHINAVAVGFEIWQGPVTNLESVDFYVEVN